MDLPDKFKFEVVGGEFPVYYANKLNSTVYEVSWEEDDKFKSCTYTVPSIEYSIKTGNWKIIKEGENMKLKPFNLKKALAGDKVVTRGGQEVVKIVHFKDANINERVIFQVEDVVYLCSEDGKYYKTGSGSQLDLFMTTTKKQGWMNIYSSHTYNVMAGGGNIYKTYQEAVENSMDGLITTVMVEWEE